MEAKATFGAGCFWGVEAAFRRLDGVTATEVGYAGGQTDNPSYEEVCSRATGHAEVVQVTYDPERVPYEQLLAVFWAEHDPTQLNRQGPDIGDQYRSVIFVHDAAPARRRRGLTRPRAEAALAAGRHPDRGRADLLAGRGLPPAVPREARARDLPRRARELIRRAPGRPARTPSGPSAASSVQAWQFLAAQAAMFCSAVCSCCWSSEP